VVDIGLDEATVKNVAARLGVSASGLYHHVHGRDDLRRLAGELLLTQHDLPRHKDEPWPEWLREIGWYLRARLIAHPLALVHHLEGAVTDEGVIHLEYTLDVLSRFGFSPVEALDAFQAVAQLAVGASVDSVRERELAQTGNATIARIHNTMALNPDGLPRVRELLIAAAHGLPDRFDSRLTLVLMGIAEMRGETWEHAESTPSTSR
jgi:AcrR family transcriptional regulator